MKIRKFAITLVACVAASIGLGFAAPAAHADSSWGFVITPIAK